MRVIFFFFKNGADKIITASVLYTPHWLDSGSGQS